MEHLRLFQYCIILILSGCSDKHPDFHRQSSDTDTAYTYRALLSRLNDIPSGETDSLLSITHPLFYAPPGTVDSIVRLCAGIYNAQEFAFIEEMDSTKKYLDYLMPKADFLTGSSLKGMLYTTAAFYELKANRDFPKGIGLLVKSADEFRLKGDLENEAATYVNIVQFFYANSDVNGMEYAEKVWSLAESNPTNPWTQCIAAMSMAQMLSLSLNPLDATAYLSVADSLASAYNFHQLFYMIDLLKAFDCEKAGWDTKADSLFRSAILWAEKEGGEPSSIQQALIGYGKFLEQGGDYQGALRQYEKGIELAHKTGGLALLDKLLLFSSDCAMRMNRQTQSLDLYKEYLKFKDSLNVLARDREVGSLTAHYRQLERDFENQRKDLALMRANRNTLTAFFCLALFATLSLFLIILNRKQRKMYRTLVKQYQHYIKKNEETPMDTSTQKDADNLVLWNKIESLMRDSKIYRKKDLSLDSLATEAGSNRTYLSKIINSFSKGDFYSYINGYRIREAVSIIESADGRKLPFKDIADKVGYNSVNVFHKVFVKETGLPPGKYRSSLPASTNCQ